MDQEPIETTPAGAALIYAVAFVTGAIVMSFEILGSRYLNPYFGSGIYTWAALISTVLAALTIGYFIGGWLADRRPTLAVLGATIVAGSLYLVALPAFASPLIEAMFEDIEDVRIGSLVAAFAILFVPVTFLGMYSPFAVRLLLRSAQRSGVVSGTVYGVSTAGSIVGTLGTAFVLMPAMGSVAITLSLGAAGVATGLLLIACSRLGRKAVTVLIPAAIVLAGPTTSLRGEELFDPQVRAQMLAKPDGRIAKIETEYNTLFINKQRTHLFMSTRYKRDEYDESIANLKDPDDLPAEYTRNMTAGLLYPEHTARILMLGLGGGSISTYLGRHMPDVSIDVVELDPGVIAAARQYFGVRETSRVRLFEGDGRVHLNRNKQAYDLILVDAFQRSGVPFHLLTREFYALVKERLTPGGAAAFNVIGGTKLYASTLLTLRAVFPTVEVYPVFETDDAEGQVVAVASLGPQADKAALTAKAAVLQQRYKFRFSMSDLAGQRKEPGDLKNGQLLTDDFAPVNLYETIPADKRKRK